MFPAKLFGALIGLGVCVIATHTPAMAAATSYPLTLQNCGVALTFNKAPQRVVALGQNTAEILLLLGLDHRMVGTAFWPTKVLPELEEANSKVKLLSVEQPSLESILAQNPDFIAAQLPILLGPDSKVVKREDLDRLGIPGYLSLGICATKLDTKDAYGSRATLWNMEYVYQEIDELSQIFDVADRGQELIARFKAREVALRERVGTNSPDLSYLFWFSSPSPADDAYLGGKNGASGFIAHLLGGHNAIDTATEWPRVSWEGIIASNPDIIVVAAVDRNRWDLDNAETKIEFLKNDPAVSQLEAVKRGHIVVMQGAAMNPTIRTIYGAEEVADKLKELGLIK
ncbi:ABC transporter substrate-binding protein [Mesorhizobium sp. M0138]|uniref:ABC transporter substrate-binding protein n=1 Tax=Mesorhizobium sp. M0138 TaxID=2956891 RepID=UPI00333BD0B4